ncbi:MAG: hypothetical protein M3003_16490 [Candidatus Dormibacteraeota bacterium]|nr:hypothetical protein [Candidatus Dormibacteraeota bacterium]
MLVDKQMIISELENRGEKDLVAQAETKLPDQVHLDDLAVQLRELGLDPEALAAKFGGNPPPAQG